MKQKQDFKNFRVNVQALILHERKILLVKRSPHSKVAPDVWNTPAGKVNLLETTDEAIVREVKEEINLSAKNFKLVKQLAYEFPVNGEMYYRLSMTYLVEVEDIRDFKLNYEHSDHRWIANATDLENSEYETMFPPLKKILKEQLREIK